MTKVKHRQKTQVENTGFEGKHRTRENTGRKHRIWKTQVENTGLENTGRKHRFFGKHRQKTQDLENTGRKHRIY